MKDYILQRKIARVIAIIAARTGETQQQALCAFYKSRVCAMMHNPATAMHLMSDEYVADEFFLDSQNGGRTDKNHKENENCG